MSATSVINLSREIETIRIPTGEKIVLGSGTPVVITQDLGGTYTVAVQGQSGLYRILNKDADAIGKPVETYSTPDGHGDAPVNEQAVWDQLRTCYDPEIPVNIVDLGLIYSMEIKPQDAGGNSVEVKMTLTAPGCGMGPSIASDAQSKILSVPGVTEARVDLVWDPPWSAERISPEGKSKLGMA